VPLVNHRQPAVVVGGLAAGLAVIRSLGPHGVSLVAVPHAESHYARASRYVTRVWQAPHPELEQERFVESLIDLAKHLHQRAVLIPTTDDSVTAIARSKSDLERHYVVACMDWPVVERFIDKGRTYELAEQAGVAAPKTFAPKSRSELHDCGDAVGYPCLVKPRESHTYSRHFKRKMVKAANLAELEQAWCEAVEAGLSVLVQELIPGADTDGVNYNVYMWDGQPLAECTARKVRLAPPEIGSPRVVVSENVPEIVEAGRALLRKLGVYGFANVEFKRDARDGRYKLMEVNGRHNRSALLSVRGGMDFPWIEYCHLVGNSLPSPNSYRLGLYWINGLSDAAQSARHFRRERYPLRDYVRPYLRPHVFDAFDLRDPRPFVVKLLAATGRKRQDLQVTAP
jgi:D-aspartate ligase